MDTPEKFVDDVITADENFYTKVHPEVIYAISPLGYILPQFAELAIEKIIGNRMKLLEKNLVPLFNELRDTIKAECVTSHIKPLYDYFVKDEIPFAMDLINTSTLNNYISVPVGTEDYLENLRGKPSCQ